MPELELEQVFTGLINLVLGAYEWAEQKYENWTNPKESTVELYNHNYLDIDDFESV